MKIEVGAKLPDAELSHMGAAGPEIVQLKSKLEGRKVVVFGLPGAYTGTCSTTHIPSFIRTAKAFREKGIEEIICISVNDPFVLGAWGDVTGATEAGITLLGDADASFTKEIEMDFTFMPIGLVNRSNRYAVVVDDGVITHANLDKPGECAVSTGEELLEAI